MKKTSKISKKIMMCKMILGLKQITVLEKKYQKTVKSKIKMKIEYGYVTGFACHFYSKIIVFGLFFKK